MKKIFYSFLFKLVVFLACCGLVTVCIDIAVFLYDNNYSINLYGGSDFSETVEYKNYVSDSMQNICKALRLKDYDKKVSVLKELDSQKVKYYIGYTDSDGERKEITDFSAEPADYMFLNEYYVIGSDGSENFDGRNYYIVEDCLADGAYGENVDLYIGYDIQGFEAEQKAWEMRRGQYDDYMQELPIIALLIILGILYLSFAAGRKGDSREIRLNVFDRIFAEFIIAAIGLLAVFGGFLTILFVMNEFNFDSPSLRLYYARFAGVAVFALCTLMYLSLIKSLKAKTLKKRFLLFRIIGFLWKKAGVVCRFSKSRLGTIKDAFFAFASKRWGIAILLFFVAYNAIVLFCGLLFAFAAEFIAIVIYAAVLTTYIFIISKYIKDIDSIGNGIGKIKNGDISYKITGIKSKYLGEMANDINTMGDGIQTALEKAVRSERMKSELVTNISHDLKTPLTSIINFSELLCEKELEPTEANDYARIIRDKSLRLKNLTADLFDISRIRSGNEIINSEKIDMCLLVRQALAEYEKEIMSSGLEYVTNIPHEEVFINADGKKMSRVISNLIENSLKYSLKNTRVYVDVKTDGKDTVFEIKNISAYKPDFDEEEITERFVRGDASRSTEGNGLGLAIAKSYTEACGGEFKIIVDGDLFKARIVFG